MARLAVLIEHRLVIDGQTDRHGAIAYAALAWRRAVQTVIPLYLDHKK